MSRPLLLLALLAACTGAAPDDADDAGGAEVPSIDAGEDTAASDCGSAEAVGWSEQTHLKGAEADYDLVFDDDRVMRLDLVFCAADREAMLEDLAELLGDDGGRPDGRPDGGPPDEGLERDPLYVPVTVAVDGLVWPSVGIRYKGNSSLQRPYRSGSMKLPFRLHFDKLEDDIPRIEDQRFHGFQELKLSNADLDPSLVRDKMAADTIRAAGIPAARGTFVEVWADPGDGSGAEYWGLYAMFEDAEGPLLDAWFGDDDGTLYKADGSAATLAASDQSAVAESFEVKTGDGDHSDIEALIDVLADTSSAPEAWRADLEAVFDVEGFLRWIALESVLGSWDSYGQMTHNHYLYADPTQGGRLVWIPWDFNETYRRDGTRPAHTVSRDETGADWPLVRRLLDDPVYQARYAELVAEHLEGAFHPDTQAAQLAAAVALVAPYATAEAEPYTNQDRVSDFDGALEGGDDALLDAVDAGVEAGWAYLE